VIRCVAELSRSNPAVVLGGCVHARDASARLLKATASGLRSGKSVRGAEAFDPQMWAPIIRSHLAILRRLQGLRHLSVLSFCWTAVR